MLINQRLTTEIGYRRHRKTVKFFKLLMMQRYASKRLSKEERRVDALALRAEERRDKLRKAAGSCK